MSAWIDNACAAVLATASVALTVPGFVRAARTLSFVDRWVLAGIKPWACDVCMCFWSTGLWTAGLAGLFQEPLLLLACGPAYTLALILLDYMQRPPAGSGPPPELPPALESEGLAEKLEGG